MTRDELIRERAYAIWQAEGEPAGREAEHWARATREVEEATDEARAAPEPPKRRTRAAKDAQPEASAAAPKPRKPRAKKGS